LLNFLYTAVSWVLLRWHDFFSLIGLNKNSGLNWALSIMFLVITARVLLVRLFIKQVHYQRHMQEMQPKMNAIKAKYKDDRQAQQREMMKLQQEEGFNPLAGCLPIALQLPLFLALFHVLRHLSNSVTRPHGDPHLTLYSFTESQTLSAAKAKLFGAPLAASFHDSANLIEHTLGGNVTSTRLVIVPLLVISAAATFLTQLMVKRNATVTPEGTAATVQKAMLYLIPLGVLASGLLFNFPLGVLLYWFTSNLWTLGQQAYIIRFHQPAPKAAAPVGEAGRSLAPRPGAKPDHNRSRGSSQSTGTNSAQPSKSATKDSSSKSVQNGDVAGGSSAGRTPRPGARPSRPANNRPAARRPSQSKKKR
jgi:YidC/Oxa1 family membrane protein insertase